MRKQTQITSIRHEPSYKQLEVKTNRTSFVYANRNGHHNTKLGTQRHVIVIPVVVNNECSNPNTVKAGVPQGSVLGPLIFLLYINDITDNLGNLARLYTDDTSLSYFGRNYDIMKSDINNDLSKLNEWAKLWLVDFNPKKTKALVISTSAVPHLDLRFNGEPVEIVKKP